MFFICLSFIALYGSALNKSGNITPHSHARCSLRHLGLGLGGQTFCSSPMGKIENVADPSLLRVPQQGRVYFSYIALCENTLKQIGNNTNPSRALRHVGGGLYESALNQAGNITPLSHARCSLRHLGLGLGGQTLCSNPMENIENVANPSLVRVTQ